MSTRAGGGTDYPWVRCPSSIVALANSSSRLMLSKASAVCLCVHWSVRWKDAGIVLVGVGSVEDVQGRLRFLSHVLVGIPWEGPLHLLDASCKRAVELQPLSILSSLLPPRAVSPTPASTQPITPLQGFKITLPSNWQERFVLVPQMGCFIK